MQAAAYPVSPIASVTVIKIRNEGVITAAKYSVSMIAPTMGIAKTDSASTVRQDIVVMTAPSIQSISSTSEYSLLNFPIFLHQI